MKFSGLKIFKFSTIIKKINIITDSISSVYKNIRRVFRNFVNTTTDTIKYILKVPSKFFELIDLRELNFRKIYKFINFKNFNFFEITKKIKIFHYENLLSYFIFLVIFIFAIYVFIPIFYNYDKSIVEKKICVNLSVKCSIEGEVKYKIFPTPRIQIKNFILKKSKEEDTFVNIGILEAKLSIKNLLNKEKQNFKSIKLKDYEINVDVKNFNSYKNIFKKKSNFIPLDFVDGKIIFFDKNKYIASINKTNFNFITKRNSKKTKLKGIFLEDEIYIDFENIKVDEKTSSEITIKMADLNLLIKASIVDLFQSSNPISGNILVKKDKNKLMGIFTYEKNELTIKKSNVRNSYLDGKLEGKIKLSPYFNFDLDLDLNSINFTKLYNYFLILDKSEIFKINNKINGNLDLSAEKIYSSYNLIKTFESEIKFNNGNISIERFIINLGKLGAADILGEINSDKKFTNFKYESNVFIDNQKKFLSKFGIYNKENISSNFFISGNLNLNNARNSFYEISSDKKFNKEDINFIEKEFNNIMLEDDYESLFRFPKFKEFIKSITTESN